ncbi:PREDICTED: uncharacterized protein LOC105557704 [Vollenhovia emeryi]|uniref:uncharacterized protein LOC105557704 n=1 Tax=Vollenhovia emeryi TaxID=411798 RepID=UPI0005F53748|nr:PREDICTED: uncharacterized protein LOC105557704 [Vollenhovia emeryi]
MAHDNETNTLELHIKGEDVNGQNLPTISEKYNTGTLRIPSDPSWPKIPPRRSSNNTDDIIEPPCVVTLTATPKKGRGAVQTAACQRLKSRLNQKYEATTHSAKRLPGCFDPRFRRQISRQKSEKPDELKVEDKDNLSEKSTTRSNKRPSLEGKRSPLQLSANERHDDVDESRYSQQEKQKSNKPLLLMVDEKKIHALPIDTLEAAAAASSSSPVSLQSLQCYSVQIPVVTYRRDVPSQISTTHTRVGKDIEMLSVCENDGDKTRENIRARSIHTNSTCSLNKPTNEKYPLDRTEQCHAKNERHASGRVCDKERVSLNRDAQALDAGDANTGSYATSNTATGLKNCDGQGCATDCASAREMSGERKTLEQKLAHRADDPSTNATCGREHSQGNEEEEKEQSERRKNREQLVNVKRIKTSVKRTTINRADLLRKANSFLRRKSRLAIADSDCTLILPGYRRVKGKRYEKSHGRSKVSLSLRGRSGVNSANSILVKYNMSKQSRVSSRLLANPRAGDELEKPSAIPLETQELLSKSYWEYYWKLARKPDDRSYVAGERDGGLSNENRLPESQTLRRCSVLSCIINTALFANRNERKRTKRASKQLLGLRATALLCIAMYVAVIFLPMVYDHFFEEYEDENAGYIELTFRHAASSFGEALDGVVNVLATIFLRPARFDRN